MGARQTPSQTVGPFFAYGLAPEQCGYPWRSVFPEVMAEARAEGIHIRITGHVYDGEGKPVPDALVEISHVDAQGRPVLSREQAVSSGFRGFGRSATGARTDHSYVFHTIRPGVAAPGEAPHVNLIVTMRGMLVHAFSRIYFDDEAPANATDPVLQSVPADRRATLIAKCEPFAGITRYRFDIHMQGPLETVFFDL